MHLYRYLKKVLIKNRNCIFLCFAFVFIIGIITHGYMYFTNAVSHDSINEFIANEQVFRIKIHAGRIFVPIYEFLIRGFITVPPLIGILSLVFLSLSLFVIIKLFSINSKIIIFLLAGILTANVSMICLNATFIHDADYDMLGLFLAIISVYIWKKERDKRISYFLASVPLIISIGLYQTYLSSAITLILFILIFDVFDGVSFKTVVFYGFKAFGMLLVTGIAYYICLKIVLIGAEIQQTGSYNFAQNIKELFPFHIIILTAKLYFRTFLRSIMPISVFSTAANIIINGMFFIITTILIYKKTFKKNIMWCNKLLLLILLLLVPISINICEILSNRGAHALMYYSICFTHIFGLLLLEREFGNTSANMILEKNILTFYRSVSIVLVVIILWGNIRLANTMYTLKEHQKDATLSLMTRVVSDIEDCEGYIPEKTEVVFAGTLDDVLIQDKEYDVAKKLYVYNSAVGIESINFYQRYFDYVMRIPLFVASNEKRAEIMETDEFKEMGTYPHQDSVQMIDGVVVVKWSE